MSTESGFLSEIRERPGDDAPRLVFADWLDDQGQADRAEFVRAQVRLAALPEWDPARFDLEERGLDPAPRAKPHFGVDPDSPTPIETGHQRAVEEHQL